MRVQQIRLGLWRWTGEHPELGEVGSVYYEAPENVVVVDPIVPPEAVDDFWRALDDDVELVGLPVRILLTAEKHRRDADTIAERYGGTVGNDPLPAGVEAFPVDEYGETVLWIAEHGALVVGDLVGGSPLARRPGIDAGPLEHLLDLPVDVVLPSHGEAVLDAARVALREALTA
jgi:glyoxylase-like metal-dependent hydrolase (beta-lactamase superfamily II)